MSFQSYQVVIESIRAIASLSLLRDNNVLMDAYHFKKDLEPIDR